MNSRAVYVILSFLMLVCIMGLSESNAQRDKKKPPQATQASSPTPMASPTPTPTPSPYKILAKIKETIEGFSKGEEALAYWRTFDFKYSSECTLGCQDCTLTWGFERHGEKSDRDEARKVDRYSAAVKLSAINPARVVANLTVVEFKTNNGQTIAVTTCKPEVVDKCDPKQVDYIDAWHISIRSEDGAERVANLLKQVLNESCPKP